MINNRPICLALVVRLFINADITFNARGSINEQQHPKMSGRARSHDSPGKPLPRVAHDSVCICFGRACVYTILYTCRAMHTQHTHAAPRRAYSTVPTNALRMQYDSSFTEAPRNRTFANNTRSRIALITLCRSNISHVTEFF